MNRNILPAVAVLMGAWLLLWGAGVLAGRALTAIRGPNLPVPVEKSPVVRPAPTPPKGGGDFPRVLPSPPPAFIEDDYDAKYNEAVRTGKPLIVWVAVPRRAELERQLSDYVHAHCGPFGGHRTGSVLVGLPRADGTVDVVAEFAKLPTPEEIEAAIENACGVNLRGDSATGAIGAGAGYAVPAPTYSRRLC